MASVNKVIVLGNLGRDPEVRYTPNGAAVCNLRIATTRNWKSRESGEKQEETEWHSVVLYDRQAEIAGEYLKKGRPVYIEGRLKTRKWQDKDGNDRYTTEIVADSMQLLGGRDDMGGGSGGGDAEGGGYSREAPSARPAARSSAPMGGGGGGNGGSGGGGYGGASSRPAPKAATGFDDMEDDIPF